ncbi:MAG: hypothetical protein AABM66_05300 [Actinomycetota bacterium]
MLAVGVAMVVAAVVLAYESRGQTLKGDEWDYAIRLSAQSLGHALFDPPPDKYLMPVPLLLYKGLFEVFGIGSYAPYRAVGIALVILCAGLFFALARRRVGDLLAIPPTILLLFFGSASEVVVTSLRIPSQIAIAAGLGMLVALDRRTLRGDVVACVLLAISLLSHPEAAAFAAAAAVFVLFRPSPERWRRSWVFGAPLALFGTLYLTQGESGTTNPALDGLNGVVSFIGESLVSLTAALSGVSGLITGPAYDSPLGWIALGLLLGAVAVALARRSKPPTPGFWAMLAALAVLLASTAIAPVTLFRTPETQRYIYPEAILLLLLLVEVARAARLHRGVAFAVTGVLAAGLVSNLADLRTNADQQRAVSDLVKAELGALELARGHADPDFLPFGPRFAALGTKLLLVTPPGAGGQGWAMRASEYFVIARDFGSPADSPHELDDLAGAPAGQAADLVLAGGLGLRLRPASPEPPPASRPRPTVKSLSEGTARTSGSCLRLSPRNGQLRAAITLPPGGVWLTGSRQELGVSRFFSLPAVRLQPLRDSHAAHLRIPRDSSSLPWTLWVDSQRGLRLCGP